jgi:hypothetical protein
MTRVFLVVTAVVALSGCGGGENPRNLTDPQDGLTVQSGSSEEETYGEPSRGEPEGKNLSSTVPHDRVENN